MVIMVGMVVIVLVQIDVRMENKTNARIVQLQALISSACAGAQ